LAFRTILLKHVEVVDNRLLLRRGELEAERSDERLRLDCGRALQLFEAALLVRGVLVDDVQVSAQPRDDEAAVELATHLTGPQPKHAKQIVAAVLATQCCRL
jgi:hypothetical protein